MIRGASIGIVDFPSNVVLHAHQASRKTAPGGEDQGHDCDGARTCVRPRDIDGHVVHFEIGGTHPEFNFLHSGLVFCYFMVLWHIAFVSRGLKIGAGVPSSLEVRPEAHAPWQRTTVRRHSRSLEMERGLFKNDVRSLLTEGFAHLNHCRARGHAARKGVRIGPAGAGGEIEQLSAMRCAACLCVGKSTDVSMTSHR